MNREHDNRNQAPVMPCGDIQALLYDYMNRELGGARSDLVREHLRHCPNCQKVAADIRRTTELLQAASRAESAIPGHLSDEHRARLTWAVLHPVRDWIDRHHILTSLALALAALAILLAALRHVTFSAAPVPDAGPEVFIGTGDPTNILSLIEAVDGAAGSEDTPRE